MGISEDLVTIKDTVGGLLETYSVLRDSDKLLWLAYLNYKHDMRNIIGEDAYLKLKAIVMDDNTPTMETIRRVRQKYQQNGEYLGEKRQEKLAEAENVKDWAINKWAANSE